MTEFKTETVDLSDSSSDDGATLHIVERMDSESGREALGNTEEQRDGHGSTHTDVRAVSKLVTDNESGRGALDNSGDHHNQDTSINAVINKTADQLVKQGESTRGAPPVMVKSLNQYLRLNVTKTSMVVDQSAATGESKRGASATDGLPDEQALSLVRHGQAAPRFSRTPEREVSYPNPRRALIKRHTVDQLMNETPCTAPYTSSKPTPTTAPGNPVFAKPAAVPQKSSKPTPTTAPGNPVFAKPAAVPQKSVQPTPTTATGNPVFAKPAAVPQKSVQPTSTTATGNPVFAKPAAVPQKLMQPPATTASVAPTKPAAQRRRSPTAIHIPGNAIGKNMQAISKENFHKRPVQRETGDDRAKTVTTTCAPNGIVPTPSEDKMKMRNPVSVESRTRCLTSAENIKVLQGGGGYVIDQTLSIPKPGCALTFVNITTHERATVEYDFLDRVSRETLERHFTEPVVYRILGLDPFTVSTDLVIELYVDKMNVAVAVGESVVRLLSSYVDTPWSDNGSPDPVNHAELSKTCLFRNFTGKIYSKSPIKDLERSMVGATLIPTHDLKTGSNGLLAVLLREFPYVINDIVAVNCDRLTNVLPGEHMYCNSVIIGSAAGITDAECIQKSVINKNIRDAWFPSAVLVSIDKMKKHWKASERANESNIILFFSVRHYSEDVSPEAFDVQLLEANVFESPMMANHVRFKKTVRDNADNNASHLLSVANDVARHAGSSGPVADESSTKTQMRIQTLNWCAKRIKNLGQVQRARGIGKPTTPRRRSAQFASGMHDIYTVVDIFKYHGIDHNNAQQVTALGREFQSALYCLHFAHQCDTLKREHARRPMNAAGRVDQQTQARHGRMELRLHVQATVGVDSGGRPTLVMMGQSNNDHSLAFKHAGPQQVRVQLCARPTVLFHAHLGRGTDDVSANTTGFVLTPTDSVFIAAWPATTGEARFDVRMVIVSGRPISRESVAKEKLQLMSSHLRKPENTLPPAISRLYDLLGASTHALETHELVRDDLVQMNRMYEVLHILNAEGDRLKRALVRCLGPKYSESMVHTIDAADRREMIEHVSQVVLATANAKLDVKAITNKNKVVIVGPIDVLLSILTEAGTDNWQYSQTTILAVTKYEQVLVDNYPNAQCTADGYRQRALSLSTGGGPYKIDQQLPILTPAGLTRGSAVNEMAVTTALETTLLSIAELVLMSTDRYTKEVILSPNKAMFQCRTLILAGVASLGESDTTASLIMECGAERVVSFWHPEPTNTLIHLSTDREALQAMTGPLATLHAHRRRLGHL